MTLDHRSHVLAFMVLATACSSNGDAAGTDTDGGGSAGSTAGTASAGTAGTESTGSAGSASSTSATGSGSASAGTDSTSGSSSDETGNSFIATGDEGGEPGPLGADCTVDADCESMKCYQSFQGGFCSECAADADCQEAGGPGACAFSFADGYASCTEGERGSSCEEQASCADGLLCESLIEGAMFTFCSDCGSDADCMDQLCAPVFSETDLGGYKTCVDPGSLENDEACPTMDMVGVDDACASGHCTAVELMNGLTLAVCGECNDADDCDPGQTCTPPEIGFGSRMGSVCSDGTGTDGGEDTGSSSDGTSTSGDTGTTG